MPRIAVITGDNLKPYWDHPPLGWDYQGSPSLMLIDADNEDHWQDYVWSTIAFPEDGWMGTTREDLLLENNPIAIRNSGYEIGYYPLDTETWDLIPIGPFCAACVDPGDDMEGTIVPPNRIELPQAWQAELIEGDEESVYCSGCGATLYEQEDYT